MGWTRGGRETKDAEFLELVSSRTGHLYRSACLLTSGDTHYAEDLVQEALSRMYVLWRRSAFTGGRNRIENPAAYTHTVMVRTFIAQQRRRSSGERPTETLPEREGHDADSSLRLTLLDALGRMSAKDRAVLVLRYWEDRSVEETAEVLRLSSGAVRTRTTRALARLRTLLGDSLAELAAR
ncbi:SigE family RNA polymerase sigma factor [Kitasatospora aureofaciens]|uniref:RNA polymerase sigma24 factor n=1 Tax=Kitasatospora aureofaciens TaxID=1894 RepID=A0A1E7MZ26_KITAU|nr:SigE family RNA polymerase sigma factor [Kitasatospora aureofaciens]ARF80348.1 SigE family RNA polymerase sigma factor [Kitasatospora aureofaciens]OEV33686.1 RNA polymerase subunit sigma-24 [Kitasatospora aureofaciens]GGV02285.1 RNA polymerase sigma24 factor [Kitasatospora aureofaciens]